MVDTMTTGRGAHCGSIRTRLASLQLAPVAPLPVKSTACSAPALTPRWMMERASSLNSHQENIVEQIERDSACRDVARANSTRDAW